MLYRFADFELDPRRAELRGPNGEAIKLRPKTFEMLVRLVASAGQIISKQELMEAVWPNVHVGDDSLFQCIREIRSALGDGERTIVKLVSGRGYVFDAEVTTKQAQTPPAASPPAPPRRTFGLRAAAAAAFLGVAVGLAIAATVFEFGGSTRETDPSIAVLPITSNAEAAETAAAVTVNVSDGLVKIDNIRVLTPETNGTSSQASARAMQADFVLNADLQKTDTTWELRARLTRNATQEVIWSAPVSVAIVGTALDLQQSRLAAGLGHLLARRLNEMASSGSREALANGAVKVAIEQANAQINQTSKERFLVAQEMLEKAIADHPGNVDAEVALAGLQMRGIQMVWYSPADAAAAEAKAKALFERATRSRPDSIPVLEAYCRFLHATNYFVESLVTCARTLSFDPWNGLVLYHMGLSQLQLDRFDDALATFMLADRYDTPQVSRWTWLVGTGLTYMLMGRAEEALPWLLKSVAITPASGRPLMLVAAAYQQMGRTGEAQATLAKAMSMRPGSNVGNVSLPPKNMGPKFAAAVEPIHKALIEAGLPAN